MMVDGLYIARGIGDGDNHGVMDGEEEEEDGRAGVVRVGALMTPRDVGIHPSIHPDTT